MFFYGRALQEEIEVHVSDDEMQAVLTSTLEISSNKLRLFHENQRTLRRQEALIERKLETKQS